MIQPTKTRTSKAQRRKAHNKAEQICRQRKCEKGLIAIKIWVPEDKAGLYKAHAKHDCEVHLARQVLAQAGPDTMLAWPDQPEWPKRPDQPEQPVPARRAGIDKKSFKKLAYRPILIEMARDILSEEGPMQRKYFCDRIAREHALSRTGPGIIRTLAPVLDAVGVCICSGSENEKDLFWPEGVAVEDILPFRGLTVNGHSRDWDQVPDPEKLGLLRELEETCTGDLLRAVAGRAGKDKISQNLRDEVEGLLQRLREIEPGA